MKFVRLADGGRHIDKECIYIHATSSISALLKPRATRDSLMASSSASVKQDTEMVEHGRNNEDDFDSIRCAKDKAPRQ